MKTTIKETGTHSFNIEDVQKYGSIEKALIMKEIKSMSLYKLRNKKDGWVYYSRNALAKKFPYMKANSIKRWMQELKKDSWLKTAIKNKFKYDKTKSYLPTELNEVETKIVPSIGQNDQPIGQNDQTIPPHSTSHSNKGRENLIKNLPLVSGEELTYEPLKGKKTKSMFLDRARAKKGKPPMLKKDPLTWGIINTYRRQYKYITGKEAVLADADYFHILKITRKMSPQDMEAMVIWYVKMDNEKFLKHPSLKSIFTVENVNKFNLQK